MAEAAEAAEADAAATKRMDTLTMVTTMTASVTEGVTGSVPGASAPEQVLAAGGVSRRRRGAAAAAGKRRSPSGGARRRAPTPDPPRDLPPDEDEDEEEQQQPPSVVAAAAAAAATTAAAPASPPVASTQLPPPFELPPEAAPGAEPRAKPRKRIKDKAAAKRSLSSPAGDRSPLEAAPAPPRGATPPPLVLKTFTSESDSGARTETIVMHSKREFKVERVELPATAKHDDEFTAPAKTTDVQQKKPKAEGVAKKAQEAEVAAKTTDVQQKKAKAEVVAKKAQEAEVAKAIAKPEGIVEEEKPPAEEEKPAEEGEKVEVVPKVRARWLREAWTEWKAFKRENPEQYARLLVQRNRCASALLLIVIYCGVGGLVFRFTEGAFEAFYKCGVKRVKRNFVDDLWLSSHHLREEDWKSQARRRLMEFENQLHTAHEAGVTSYSGQRSWSFLNAVVYSLTVVTTIGYGHLSPSTTTGRAITIVYAIFGIPLFLILLADFGKLFTRGIKFLWAFVRRLYFTGSCRKVRRTVPVQEVMKGVQLVYDFAKFRRPSEVPPGEGPGEENDVHTPLNQQPPPPQVQIHEPSQPPEGVQQTIPLDGREPTTPVPSVFEVDDEFNLPISIAITILLTYIFVGAAVYYIWEDWGFFESFYFVFISMSTIGFGDFVPKHPMYMMASIVYLVFGLALTSMCINVVQEKLSDSFRQASAKIGATIGLRVAEEEGDISPVEQPTSQPQEAEVVPAMTKSAST